LNTLDEAKLFLNKKTKEGKIVIVLDKGKKVDSFITEATTTANFPAFATPLAFTKDGKPLDPIAMKRIGWKLLDEKLV